MVIEIICWTRFDNLMSTNMVIIVKIETRSRKSSKYNDQYCITDKLQDKDIQNQSNIIDGDTSG